MLLDQDGGDVVSMVTCIIHPGPEKIRLRFLRKGWRGRGRVTRGKRRRRLQMGINKLEQKENLRTKSKCFDLSSKAELELNQN